MPLNPQIRQFEAALDEERFVADLAAGRIPQKAVAFDKWRGKLLSGEDKVAADALWERFLAKKAAPPKPASPAERPYSMQMQGASRPPEGRAGYGGEGTMNVKGAAPSVLGEPFHNPYTFIPFASAPPRRRAPTPLTIDEKSGERDRFTGVLDLSVRLLSPLMTLESLPTIETDKGHKTFGPQLVGDDVIVPATGVRGALRSLMSLLTGGTLSHLDEEAWLCQGRDAHLGPASASTRGSVPDHAFLAEVEIPGSIKRAGTVRLGDTKLVKAEILEATSQRLFHGRLPRPDQSGRAEEVWSNVDGSDLTRTKGDAAHPWRLKASGRPLPGSEHRKREGLFFPSNEKIDLRESLWSAYNGRNRHSVKPGLGKGDLVWLEPANKACTAIRNATDVKSIQWARWGREGERLLDVVARHHPQILPDALNPDGLVDEVSDLFGQVPRGDLTKEVEQWAGAEGKPAGPFAARVRSGNLVFRDARTRCQMAVLAPLQAPHPGCAAFYRDTGHEDPGVIADVVSNKGHAMRGYKVYRTTSERGSSAPWHFAVQGTYGATGALEDPRRTVNKTASLLPEGEDLEGRLRLTLRACSVREVTLLLAACAVDWRLGGGKPLGLGHCRVVRAVLSRMKDDGTLEDAVTMTRPTGDLMSLPENYGKELSLDTQLGERMRLWQATQSPVGKLRYPRSVEQNRNRKSRGGHVWFARHAQPRKTSGGESAGGLQVMRLAEGGELRKSAGADWIRAQPLPKSTPAAALDDVLHGYDLFGGEGPEWRADGAPQMKVWKKLEPFDAERHARAEDRGGGALGQNRGTREDARRRR